MRISGLIQIINKGGDYGLIKFTRHIKRLYKENLLGEVKK